MPQVAVPLATLRGSNDGGSPIADLPGSAEPFTAETLRSLYTSPDDYVERLGAAIADAVSSGVLLARDAPRLRQEALAASAVLAGSLL